jgi:RND family efflux transporter MFP subunit
LILLHERHGEAASDHAPFLSQGPGTMNPIVFAMRRPFSVMVLVVAVALGSGLALWRMPIDIFPNLNLPVIYVAQPYGGMDPAQMEGLLTNYYEYHFLYIAGIHHVESRNVQGMAVMKLFFHPGTNMAQAMAETIGYVTRSRAFMPPGTVSPFITRFDAGSVPVGYLVLSSETRPIGEIQDQALFKVRPMFASLPGVSAPPPFGGNQRTVVVRADPERLRSYALSPDELIEALDRGNVISPSGNVRIGEKMPIVPINSLVRDVKELEDIPIRVGSNPSVYLRDVATVKDASDIPSGYALVNGRRAIYILVTKRADASTYSVVQNVKAALPMMQAVLPDDIRVRFEFDQSPTVTNAVRSLATEGALGAVLIGLMVLVFLRDWRSVVVVVLNIPLAIAGALVALWLTGQSINLMTLGGLALAIGILVDEATVEIENIHHKLEQTESVALAVRQGNLDTAVPRLLAMLCILAVFLPSFFMQGAAQALFVPLSLAVGFAMVASYLLSSTFVPVLSTWMLRRRHRPSSVQRRSLFDRLASSYARALTPLVRGRWGVVVLYLALCAGIIPLVWRELGMEIFPRVDAGRFQLRMRAPTGTRIEETEKLAVQALGIIQGAVGKDAVDVSVGYIGLIPSNYPINAIYQWTGGPEEVVLRFALKQGKTRSIEELKERLRDLLSDSMPDVRFSFEPADIVSEVMSFGSPTPVEIAVNGPNLAENRDYTEKIRAELATVPELRDLQVVQSLDYPTVNVQIDRERAGLSGVAVAEVARSVLAATSSSRFVVPNYWPDPKTGIGYQVQVEIPYQAMDSLTQVGEIPIQHAGDRSLLLRDVATISPGTMPGEYDRYNMKRLISLTANLGSEDLGRVSRQIDQALSRAGQPPAGATVEVRGQIAPMKDILRGLLIGLGLAVFVILLLLTANFQSVLLALVVISTTPAVVAGVLLALWLTGTTINLQSFMGSIMAIGVAVANAILLVTFAERSRLEGADPVTAAVEGARGRLRPILMTGCAMIAGMVPMALGWNEGGEQTAPLGRAVIGGLAAATLTTLAVLPAVFALVQAGASRKSASIDPFDPSSSHYAHDPQPPLTVSSANGEPAERPSQPPVSSGLLGLLILSALVTTTPGCARWSPAQSTQTQPPAQGGSPPPTKVETVRVERRTIRRITQQPGQIEAYELTPVYAKVSGYVRQWNVDIGKHVKKGQSLAVIDVPELDAEVKLKQASVEEAQAKLAQARAADQVAQASLTSARTRLAETEAGINRAEADLIRWKAEFSRVEELHRDRALTGSLLDETRSKLKASEASLAEEKAQAATAGAQVQEAEARLTKTLADIGAAEASRKVAEFDVSRSRALQSYATITAPYDGVVTQRNIDVGDITQVGSQGQPLFTITRDDVVRVTVSVPEMYAVDVDPGDPVLIRLQAMAGKEIEGKVARTSWSLDPRSRTLRVEVDLPNPSRLLRPGLYVHAAVGVEEHRDALTVPTTALIRQESQSFCVAVANGRAVRKPVRTGFEEGPRTEITSGLEDGEEIVKASAAVLRDGQEVTVVAPEPKPG